MRASLVILLGIAAGTAAVLVPPRLIEPGGAGHGGLARTKITFTVWGMPFEDRLFLDGYARGYEQVEPRVAVDYQRHADPNMKYNAWHARGYGPEVMRIQIPDYHQMVARGMLEPLDQYMADSQTGLSAEQLADFPPQILDALRVDGKLYALPEDNAVFGLYYNKSIFDAYNAEHADARLSYPSAVWTWADLRDAACKLTKRDDRGHITTYGVDMTLWQWPFMNFYAEAGGSLWSGDGLTTLVNRARPDGARPGVEALEFLRAIAFEDRAWEPSFGKDQGTGPDSRFVSGSVAMYFDGSWMAPSLETRNPALDFAIAPVPRGRVNAVVSGSCLWGISTHAANKSAGWRMIRWLVSPEQAARYWDTLRVAPPASLSVINSEQFHETHGIPNPARPGEWFVPPMPPEKFADRAEWILHAYEPDPATGRAPAFVATSLYQRALEDELMRGLQEALQRPSVPAQEILDRIARNVHAVIDRDRAARRLPAVLRDN